MKQSVIRIELEGVNCYLLKEGDNFILFDTGGHVLRDKQFSIKRNELRGQLEKSGVTPENLKLVILTHGDIDHTANADYIRQKYETKIAMHKNDVKLVQTADVANVLSNFKMKSLPLRIFLFFMKGPIRKALEKMLGDFEGFTPDLFLDEGEDLVEYGFNAKVLYIPGHTAGSIAVLTDNCDLISGDIFANINKPGLAPNALDFGVMQESADRLKKMNIRMIYPGHGTPFEANELK